MHEYTAPLVWRHVVAPLRIFIFLGLLRVLLPRFSLNPSSSLNILYVTNSILSIELVPFLKARSVAYCFPTHITYDFPLCY